MPKGKGVSKYFLGDCLENLPVPPSFIGMHKNSDIDLALEEKGKIVS